MRSAGRREVDKCDTGLAPSFKTPLITGSGSRSSTQTTQCAVESGKMRKHGLVVGCDAESPIRSQRETGSRPLNSVELATDDSPSRSAPASSSIFSSCCYWPRFADFRCVDALTINSGGSRIASGFGTTLDFKASSTSRAASLPIWPLCWSMLERGTRNESS